MKTLFLFICLTPMALAQKMEVKIIGHDAHQFTQTRNLPGVALSNGNATANCGAYGSVANCTASGTSGTIYAPPRTIENTLQATYLTLLLPDGRKALAYCEDRIKDRLSGMKVYPCKSPSTDRVTAKFSGKKVKLSWPVSIDGKKSDSQEYEVYGIVSQ